MKLTNKEVVILQGLVELHIETMKIGGQSSWADLSEFYELNNKLYEARGIKEVECLVEG